ncbi:DUF4230 domain-containing protein [Pseudotamlana carrageenivorans]|uniref:DUF4230 domain-containing protein n=1 Tax=Pseudotamlana carrageenivorans TaxID=2069432 RepID=A0A2I7SEL8_9FLAO|nr:DUF4230 domain-containing protein [Tamlana carrageenivorans]AUS04310.1 hypothetical protein C1A40_01955 [Tamlana carrageenivorans]
MRKILIGVVITLVALYAVKSCERQKAEKTKLVENSALIKQQINNVGKLVVTEGHFSQVFNYQNSKDLLGNYLTLEKKALVVVNANVTVAYDLSKIEFKVDEASKTLSILKIPEEEITISPDFEYYDVQADFLNPFEAQDYNKIKNIVNASLKKKINQSQLKTNAKNRLISELSKFYILTNSLGWTLEYNQTPINQVDDFKGLKL